MSFPLRQFFLFCSEDHPTNRRVLMQAVNSGVYVNFFNADSNNPSIFLQFPAYVPIANGQWHHIAITWSGKHDIFFFLILCILVKVSNLGVAALWGAWCMSFPADKRS